MSTSSKLRAYASTLFPYFLAIFAALCTSRAESQTFTTLVRFTGTSGTASGKYPYGSLTLVGTNIYGMTEDGGLNGYGNIFCVGSNGTNYQNLLSFTGASGTANGMSPEGSLTLVGTALYGTTGYGGASGYGSVFSVGTNGTNYQNLVSFANYNSSPGSFPHGSLTLAVSGLWLYGMTWEGGTAGSHGTIFDLGTNGGQFQVLASFTGTAGSASGHRANGSLTIAGTNLYGMTSGGGSNGLGNVFSLGVNGTNFQNLVSFTGTGGIASGAYPSGSLTLVGTRLYGMTESGGANGHGNVFSVGTDGTRYQNLLSFGGTASGQYPYGSLTLSGSALYGMTRYGNIFSLGLDGSDYHDLHNFTGADGGYPYGDLLLSGGTLFGMTSDNNNGPVGNGTVFAYSLPPVPEPGTLALVGTGAAAVVAYRWRRRRRSSAAPPI